MTGMKYKFPRVAIFFGFLSLLMVGCTNQMANQKVLVNANAQMVKIKSGKLGESGGNALSEKPAGVTNLKQTLTKQSRSAKLPDYFLTLKYTSKQVKLNKEQSTQLNDVLHRLTSPKHYLVEITTGPLRKKHIPSIRGVYFGEMRVRNVQKFVQSKVGGAEGYYDPRVPAGIMLVHFQADFIPVPKSATKLQ